MFPITDEDKHREFLKAGSFRVLEASPTPESGHPAGKCSGTHGVRTRKHNDFV